jgi:hypothetical protein
MVVICEVLGHLIEEFAKIDGKDFKINYVKVALPAKTSETDREKIWSVLWGDDESRRWSEYTDYPLSERAEDAEPSHIVYGALVGTNVTEGWRAIEGTIIKTVKQLLLRRYEPEDMPNSDTFLDNFSKFADTKVPIQQQVGEVYLWYEFLLKLSQEQGAFIESDRGLSEFCMKELPCITKIQELKTDVLTASLKALRYLHKKEEFIKLGGQLSKKLNNWADHNKKLSRNLSGSLTGMEMEYNKVQDFLLLSKPDIAKRVQEQWSSILSCSKEIDQLTANGTRTASEKADKQLGSLRHYVYKLAQTLEVVSDYLAAETWQEASDKTGGTKKVKKKLKQLPKNDFSFGNGQVFFKGKDLELPTGAEVNAVELLKKLVKSFGKIVPYKTLDENSADTASDFLRGKIRTIKLALQKHKVPYTIKSKKWTGYVLTNSRTHS